MNYERKYRELAEAVKDWLDADDKLALHGSGAQVNFRGMQWLADEAFDFAKNKVTNILYGDER